MLSKEGSIDPPYPPFIKKMNGRQERPSLSFISYNFVITEIIMLPRVALVLVYKGFQSHYES